MILENYGGAPFKDDYGNVREATSGLPDNHH